MIRTQVQLTSEQIAQLKELANVYDVSMAEVIRRSIDDYLSANRSVDRAERQRRALAVVGKFRSGVHDTSIHHDRYLGEALPAAGDA